MLKPFAICAAIALAFAYPAMADDVTPADDVPQAVKDACQGDYDKHCSQFGEDRQAVRECMAQAFEKLSDPCVTAILDSPLADQQAPQQDTAQMEEGPQPIPASHETTAPKKKHIARLEHSTHAAKAKHHARTVHANHQARSRERNYAHHASGSRRSVAGYIRRGTGIANHYVAKYTRFALAKVFR